MLKVDVDHILRWRFFAEFVFSLGETAAESNDKDKQG